MGMDARPGWLVDLQLTAVCSAHRAGARARVTQSSLSDFYSSAQRHSLHSSGHIPGPIDEEWKVYILLSRCSTHIYC